MSLNSTAINASWNPPAVAQQNGLITNYVVHFSSLQSGLNYTYDVHSQQLVIGSLRPYSVYSVAVASENSIGVGPYTEIAVVQTLEDGIYNLICYNSFFLHISYHCNQLLLPLSL